MFDSSSKDKTLADLHVGDSAMVVRILGDGALRRRIMDMGITKNTIISVMRIAPLGDPIELTVRGFELSIRKEEAARILVQKI